MQLFGDGSLADVVHEFEQVLPPLLPEAGLHVTQERQVLLPGVGLGEQVLEGFAQGQQDLFVVYWLVSASNSKQNSNAAITFGYDHEVWCEVT